MKRFIIAICMSGLMSAAHAADTVTSPKSPTVEELQTRIEFLTAALQGARQQRDAAMSALADAQLQASVIAQTKAPIKK